MTVEGPPEQPVTIEVVTKENYEEASRLLSHSVWTGDYDTALPLADKILAFRTEIGEREAALIPYASIYYSAATGAWAQRETAGTVASLRTAGSHMLRALESLDERIRIEEEKQSTPQKGRPLPSFDAFSADELDVIQSVYGNAAKQAHKIPLANTVIELIRPSRRGNFVNSCDEIAEHAISAGLRRVAEAEEQNEPVAPHTALFLHFGAMEIAERHGKTEEMLAHAQAVRALGEAYPWPNIDGDARGSAAQFTAYGQAARVARKVAEACKVLGDTEGAKAYGTLADQYAELVPDQKAKRNA